MGSGTYSPQDFLRKVDNRLLAGYFKHRRGLHDVDISGLKQTEILPIYEAMQALPFEEQQHIEKDFFSVHALADEPGIIVLFEEIREKGGDVPAFKKKRGYHDKAMWAFLEHNEIFRRVSRFNSYRPSKTNWRRLSAPNSDKFRKDNAACKALSQSLSEMFVQSEGRGYKCAVEYFFFQGKHFFFAYPSDYHQVAIEWNNDEFIRRYHDPALEVVFVYPEDGSYVDVYYHGTLRMTQRLMTLWSKDILGQEIDYRHFTQHFSIQCFGKREHGITLPATSRVSELEVKAIRFYPEGNVGVSMLLQADARNPTVDVYDLMESMNMQVKRVLSVRLAAHYSDEETFEDRQKLFNLSPDSCNLSHGGIDGTIRCLLRETGIEVRRE